MQGIYRALETRWLCDDLFELVESELMFAICHLLDFLFADGDVDLVHDVHDFFVGDHAVAIDRVARLLPSCYPLADRRAAAYSEAIATLLRKGAPTAVPSIDRRCLYNYAQACRGEAIEAPICFVCACVYPRLAARRRN